MAGESSEMMNVAHKAETILSPWRADFPALGGRMHDKPLVFLDSGASAQKPLCVIEAMNAVMRGGYANIHRGLYEISQTLTHDYEAVRGKVARFIGAPSAENIVFTRNSTEGINLVAQSWGRRNLNAGDEIILSVMEHHANIVPWQLLAEDKGFTIKVIPMTTEGLLDLEAFKNLLSKKTKFIGVVEVSNGIGTINPVADMIKTARHFNSDIKILVDGSQAVVHGAADVTALDTDFYVFTGHKLYGPTGIGVLYGKYEILDAMRPYQGGGDMIDRVSFERTTYRQAPYKFEAGTPAIVEVIGLGAALDYLSRIGMSKIMTHEQHLLSYAHERLSAYKELKIHGPSDLSKKAGLVSFTLSYAHPSDIGMILDQCGVAVRTGHHCCMPLMAALGVDATVRASFGLYNTSQDIDALCSALETAERLLA